MSALLEVRDLRKRFGGVLANDGISLTVRDGETVGIIGPNGSGKSTLFDLITGFQAPDDGAILFRGQSILSRRPDAINRLGIGRTFQTMRPFTSMTVRENVVVALLPRSRSVQEAAAEAARYIEFVGLTEKADSAAATLSTGQRKRLEVARTLATSPQLILMDEPAGGVDPTRLRELLALIQQLKDTGAALLIVEHNMRVIRAVADRLVAIDRGRVIAEGDPDVVVRDPRVLEAYLGEPSTEDGAPRRDS